MIPYTQFFMIYASSLAVAICVALYLMAGSPFGFWRPALAFLRRNYTCMVVLAAFPLMVQSLSLVKTYLSDGDEVSESISNGHLLFSVGGGLITNLQIHIDSDLAAGYFMFTYMWIFAFFTYFLPILFVVKRDKSTFVAFTIAVAVNYLVLIPFYTMFPVAVSSRLPHVGVEPLLYSSANWGTMAASVDSLTNCFPSGHVSLSFTALFVIMLAGQDYRRLSYILGATAVSIGIAVLYLGIHYPLDVLGGLALAVASTVIARSDTIRTTLARVICEVQSTRQNDT